MWNDDYGHWDMMDSGAAWLMLVVLLVIAAAIVALLVILLRYPGPTGRGESQRRPSEDVGVGILRERLARGEIDEDEYESRLRVLKRS
jgi:putative membrane protein